MPPTQPRFGKSAWNSLPVPSGSPWESQLSAVEPANELAFGLRTPAICGRLPSGFAHW